jgi:sialic acid synthase SpsE
MKAGEPFTVHNVRSIRPAQGLHTRYLPQVLGKLAARPIESGTPLTWNHVADPPREAWKAADDLVKVAAVK